VKRALLLAGLLLSACHPKSSGPIDFSGLWMPDTKVVTPVGGTIPLLPAAAAVAKANATSAERGDFGFDNWMKCSLHGMPRIMLTASPFRLLQTPAKLYTVHAVNHSYRVMPIVAKHGAGEPSYMGDAIASIDGDRLHIETTKLVAGLIDREGLPHSDALKLTEDYKLSSDGQTLSGTIRIEDPKTFSAPWSFAVSFHRLAPAELPENICVDLTDAQKKALR